MYLTVLQPLYFGNYVHFIDSLHIVTKIDKVKGQAPPKTYKVERSSCESTYAYLYVWAEAPPTQCCPITRPLLLCSAVFSELEALLPRLAAAERELRQRLGSEPAGSLSMEAVEDGEPCIEMVS